MDRKKLMLLRTLLVLLVVGALWLQHGWRAVNLPPAQPPAGQDGAHHESEASIEQGSASSTRSDVGTVARTTIVPDVTIRDERGNVVYRGDVDLSETLTRIDRGERLRFRNDGAIFENRERRLPREPRGYYHEYVHPTPDLPGPGPQRIVQGEQRETYYTHDHYRTFRRLDRP